MPSFWQGRFALQHLLPLQILRLLAVATRTAWHPLLAPKSPRPGVTRGLWQHPAVTNPPCHQGGGLSAHPTALPGNAPAQLQPDRARANQPPVASAQAGRQSLA